MDVGLVVLALAAVLVGATLQRISGMGMALMVAPTLVLLLGPVTGVLLTNATAVVSAALVLVAVRRDVDWRRYALMMPAAVLGAVPGALVVRAAPAAWLEIVVGGLILLGLLGTAALHSVPQVRGAAPTLAAGVAGGFLSTTAGVAGPALVIYATVTRWEQRAFRATLQPTFMTMAAISLLAKGALGATGPAGLPPWWLAAGIAAMLVLGITVGGRLSRRIDSLVARRTAVAIAVLGAVATLVRGLVGAM
ncbi:sulfite exporter TauE/SafE family protein [Georgenia sp. 10Sc9-8]|uniref:Probable membrane transporter protein n=1 Tax=Georgenia halotolerans TaxID=3028317 RepID=A0ABT5TXJ3_9MICO|nr:sulfite exporter TauE/SafE family protein [Georgenia halotolerans]